MKNKLKKFFEENKELLENSFNFPKVEFNEEKISIIYPDVDIYKNSDESEKLKIYNKYHQKIEDEIYNTVGIIPTKCIKSFRTWYILKENIQKLKLKNFYNKHLEYLKENVYKPIVEYIDNSIEKQDFIRIFFPDPESENMDNWIKYITKIYPSKCKDNERTFYIFEEDMERLKMFELFEELNIINQRTSLSDNYSWSSNKVNVNIFSYKETYSLPFIILEENINSWEDINNYSITFSYFINKEVKENLKYIIENENYKTSSFDNDLISPISIDFNNFEEVEVFFQNENIKDIIKDHAINSLIYT